MQKALLLFFLLFSFSRLFAQYSSKESAGEAQVKTVGILCDDNYSLESVRTDTLLSFSDTFLKPAQCKKYWFKIEVTNRSAYAQSYVLTVLPSIDNTLYYFNEDIKGWIAHRVGILVPSDKGITKGRVHVKLQGGRTTTIFANVSLGNRRLAINTVKPQIILEKEEVVEERIHFFTTASLVSLTILLVLFLNAFHLYYRFRDLSTLYFLIIQVGCMVYLFSYRFLFNVTFPGPLFSYFITPNGLTPAYGINQLFMHLSVAVIMYGLVHMTRHYLQSKITLPKWDFWLRHSLSVYLIITTVGALINMSGFFVDNYSLILENILVLLVAGLSLTTSMVAWLRKVFFARAYVFAHVLPLLFLVSIAVYHVFISSSNGGHLLLPDLGVISQALCFSAAITSRMKLLQERLLAKEKEAYQLELDIKKGELMHRQLALENTQIKAAMSDAELEQKNWQQQANRLNAEMAHHQAVNKELKEKLESNNRELASTMMYVAQKNAMLASLKTQIGDMGRQSSRGQVQQISGIKSLIQSNLQLDDDWNRFKLHFEQVHPRFFEELQLKYPTLTKNELRLYSYFHINLSTKEIASLLNIDPARCTAGKNKAI